MAERSFDPGRDTPLYNEPGAGQVVPGSPVDEDAKSREDADARLAELSGQVNDRPDLATAGQPVDEPRAQDERSNDVRQTNDAQRGATRKSRNS